MDVMAGGSAEICLASRHHTRAAEVNLSIRTAGVSLRQLLGGANPHNALALNHKRGGFGAGRILGEDAPMHKARARRGSVSGGAGGASGNSAGEGGSNRGGHGDLDPWS